MTDVVALALRALAYASSLLAAGLPIFVLLHGHLLDRSSRRIRSAMRPTALIALASLALHALVEPMRLTGTWSGMLDASLHAMLLSSDFGTTLATRGLGLILIVSGARQTQHAGTGLTLLGAALVALSFTFMGHTAAAAQRWLLAPLLLVHLLAVAFWFGSLWPLLTVTRLETPAVGGAIVERFSQNATYVVPLVLLAGLAIAGLLLPGLSALQTPYGASLIAKIGIFAALMLAASLNKWRLAPRIAGGDPVCLQAFRISVWIEAALICTAVAVTASMTALYSPDF